MFKRIQISLALTAVCFLAMGDRSRPDQRSTVVPEGQFYSGDQNGEDLSR